MNMLRTESILALILVPLLGAHTPARGSEDEQIASKLEAVGAEVERDEYGVITTVDFDWNPIASDDDLRLLAKLDHLSEVSLSEMRFTVAGLKHLASLSTLNRLCLSRTKFTDTDIKFIQGLTSLEELDLSGTAVTDGVIPELAELQSLKRVNLSSTRVTPVGLRLLKKTRSELYIDESWDYSASFAGGYGVLDTDRVTFIFRDITGSGGGSGGGSIRVSPPESDEDPAADSAGTGWSGGGGGFFFGNWSSIHATSGLVDGLPTIRVGKHRVEILRGGEEVAVDGQSFIVGRKKLRVIVDAGGIAKLADEP